MMRIKILGLPRVAGQVIDLFGDGPGFLLLPYHSVPFPFN